MKRRARFETILALGAAALVAVSCQTVGKASGWEPILSERERQDRFIEGGYDSAFRAGELWNDYETFIKRHGDPQSMLKMAIVNPHDRVKDEELILFYERYELRYYVYSKRDLWDPPKSLLMAALSREGGKYLFGVGLGMDEAKVLSLLGLTGSEGPNVQFQNLLGHRVSLSFEAGHLSSIIWDYSRE